MMETAEIKRSHGLIRTAGLAVAIVAGLLFAPAAVFAHDEQQKPQKPNDFPTYARAEYVYICMSANGVSEYVLRQCSCAIDEIANRMSYDDYVAAETAVRFRQMRGERASQFREVEVVRRSVRALRAAQAEAEIACF